MKTSVSESAYHSAAINSQTDGSIQILIGKWSHSKEGVILDIVCTQRKNGLQYTPATLLYWGYLSFMAIKISRPFCIASSSPAAVMGVSQGRAAADRNRQTYHSGN
jgi:hypothetical protein